MTNSFLLLGTGEEDKHFADEAVEILIDESRPAESSTPETIETP